jgi:hypothetical protein
MPCDLLARPFGRCAEGTTDSLVLAAPRSPDRYAPIAGPLLVVRQVLRVEHVQHCQWAWASASAKDGEVASLLEYPWKQVAHEARWHFVFQAGAEADEVDKDRLTIAPVDAVTRVLRHVCIYDKPMSGWVPEPLALIGLHLPERLPAATRARDVRMDRTVNVGKRSAASRACRCAGG